MIHEAIKRIAKPDTEPYSIVGKVLEVDESARTCDVQPLNGDADLLDIRLQAVQEMKDGVILVPKKGSWVIVTFLAKADGFVSERSNVEKILWGIGSAKMEYTADGLRLENAVTDLKTELSALFDTLDALLTTLTTFTVGTSVGPSVGVMPPTITSILQHKVDLLATKTKIETLLK